MSERERNARQADAWTEARVRRRARTSPSRGLWIVGLGPGSTQATRCSTSPAATAASAMPCSSAACATTASSEMAAEARLRLRDRRAPVDVGDLNEYAPPNQVAATTVFRAIYYAHDRRAFFRGGLHVKKLVFDLNPRQYRLDDVLDDLRAAGLGRIVLRPFFVPQTVALPRPVLAVAKSLERSRPIARLAPPLPLHVPRRGVALTVEQRPEADVHRRSELAPIGVRGIESCGERSARWSPRPARGRSAREAGTASSRTGGPSPPVSR